MRFKLQHWFIATIGGPVALSLFSHGHYRAFRDWYGFLNWECRVTDTEFDPGTPAYWDTHNQPPGTKEP